ncbi:TetR/AcrR family transcriptional regulator [Mucilaginibacter aquaedulcis]|uniref:TetR/AcrR family transcriptional regulator n=1 Tax=Mucilaginibacter aquaedulcis TaxID=1187081 RepID=UPI0025B3C6D1|nr:TetR/AcrR family transcriptional regulator [Mucilaginibacter aquaedulcis]MDN3550039.1 TetR/AcrR family transcriptional regulator [Mucilaginibacter aquaedulcis]
MARNLEFNEEEAIKKAMEVFWKKGYGGTSIRDLAEAMNIKISSIYNTMGDKHQLFIKCIRNYTQTRAIEAQNSTSRMRSPFKAIINFIEGAVHTILYSPNSCLAIKTTFEVAATDPDLQAILRDDHEFTYGLLTGLIKKAVELKELPEDTDAGTLADFILNNFTGWHESYIIHQNPVRIKKMAKYLIAQISK